MWFQRMSLEEWFDAYQFRTRYDVGESAVKFLKVRDLGVDLSDVDLRYGHHWGRPELRELDQPGIPRARARPRARHLGRGGGHLLHHRDALQARRPRHRGAPELPVHLRGGARFRVRGGAAAARVRRPVQARPRPSRGDGHAAHEAPRLHAPEQPDRRDDLPGRAGAPGRVRGVAPRPPAVRRDLSTPGLRRAAARGSVPQPVGHQHHQHVQVLRPAGD